MQHAKIPSLGKGHEARLSYSGNISRRNGYNTISKMNMRPMILTHVADAGRQRPIAVLTGAELPKETDEDGPASFQRSCIEFGFGKLWPHHSQSSILTSAETSHLLHINSAETALIVHWALREKPEMLTRDFHIIAHFFHTAIPSSPDRSAKSIELDCTIFPKQNLNALKWAASGKSVWETSVIINASERTARFHLDQARLKLKCTTKIQAVAKAVATGLINIS